MHVVGRRDKYRVHFAEHVIEILCRESTAARRIGTEDRRNLDARVAFQYGHVDAGDSAVAGDADSQSQSEQCSPLL